MNLGSNLIVIFGFIIVVVVSYMLVGQIGKENESRAHEIDDSIELIRNCQAGEYVQPYSLGADYLTINPQNNEKCIIQRYGVFEDASWRSSCEIPMNEMQKFQGMKSFYYEPEGNFVKYCETIESGTVWDKIP